MRQRLLQEAVAARSDFVTLCGLRRQYIVQHFALSSPQHLRGSTNCSSQPSKPSIGQGQYQYGDIGALVNCHILLLHYKHGKQMRKRDNTKMASGKRKEQEKRKNSNNLRLQHNNTNHSQTMVSIQSHSFQRNNTLQCDTLCTQGGYTQSSCSFVFSSSSRSPSCSFSSCSPPSISFSSSFSPFPPPAASSPPPTPPARSAMAA